MGYYARNDEIHDNSRGCSANGKPL